jgi:hypothetical protein
MQLFLSFVAILTTAFFSYMIFKAMNKQVEFIYLIGYITITPILTVLFFKNKDI